VSAREAERSALVTFEPSGCTRGVAIGTTIKQAAAEAGVVLDAPCGGLGTCGRCLVGVEGALEPPASDERILLTETQLAEGIRLACRAAIAGDVVVRPASAQRPASVRVVERGDAGEIAVEPPEDRGILGDEPLLGAVVDIGTTTLVVSVVDLRTAETLGAASDLNPQYAFGHDVMSRITHAATHGEASLREPVIAAIESLALRALRAAAQPAERLREIAVAGNTTMIHLLLGIDPAPLGVAPYEPAFVQSLERDAASLGLPALRNARAYVLPGVSAFVGADITAGLLATRLAERSRPTLFVDLGTNGEMVLRTPDALVACSTAAGPALEGATLTHGMRAETGAIERVSLDGGRLTVDTIDAAPPRGLCGSGLLDLVAVLLEAGVLDFTGRLRTDAGDPLGDRVVQHDGGRAFEIAPAVYLAQRDVRQVQLANAAIASGISLLLDGVGLVPEDVAELVIAGGFGYHVKAEALVRLGMIPAAWIDRVSFAGNTAVSGTLLALLDSAARRRAEALTRRVETVDLAGHPEFQTRFVAAMRFPKGTQPLREDRP